MIDIFLKNGMPTEATTYVMKHLSNKDDSEGPNHRKILKISLKLSPASAVFIFPIACGINETRLQLLCFADLSDIFNMLWKFILTGRM